jgi:hypothetical protein
VDEQGLSMIAALLTRGQRRPAREAAALVRGAFEGRG